MNPAILGQLDPPRDWLTSGSVAPPMRHRGRIVLDKYLNPVLDYPDIPHTLASNAEAWLLEAIIRQNSCINWKDIQARMPDSTATTSINAMQMRVFRWRNKHNCISWHEKRGTDELRANIWRRMPVSNKIYGRNDFRKGTSFP